MTQNFNLSGDKGTELRTTRPKLSDIEVVDRCKKSMSGTIFDELYNGCWEIEGYESIKDADQALCDFIATHTTDPVQIERIISGSIHYSEDWDTDEEYKKQIIIESLSQADIKISKKDDPQNKYFGKRNKFIPKALADEILQDHFFITMKDNPKEIYHYKNGVYRLNGREVLEEIALDLLDECYKSSHIEELVNYVQIKTRVERGLVNKDTFIINYKNGLYDVELKEFSQHTPDFLSTIQIQAEYDPTATCPKIDMFLTEVVSEEDKEVLLEWLGYSMIPDTRMQKAVMLYGTGSNGKGVLLNIFNKLIGGENISGESLQKLNKERFSSANLYGKLLNIFPDLPSTALYDDSMFKCLVGGDVISGELKFGKVFRFLNIARLLFSANKLPKLAKEGDDKYAFYRRWMLIKFDKRFEGNDADIDLLQKLTTPEEMSGLLNKALSSLDTLLRNGKFSYNKTVEEVERLYRIESDPVELFVEECVKRSENITFKSVMHQEYVRWCLDNGVSPVEDNSLGRKLKELGFTADRETTGDRQYYWKEVTVVRQ